MYTDTEGLWLLVQTQWGGRGDWFPLNVQINQKNEVYIQNKIMDKGKIVGSAGVSPYTFTPSQTTNAISTFNNETIGI